MVVIASQPKFFLPLKFTFPKSARLRFSRQFQECERFGEKRVGLYLVVHLLFRREKSDTKLGITVSRHFGMSTVRNQFKRKLRETFRLSRDKLPRSVWLHVRPRTSAKMATQKEINEDFRKILFIADSADKFTLGLRQSPGAEQSQTGQY